MMNVSLVMNRLALRSSSLKLCEINSISIGVSIQYLLFLKLFWTLNFIWNRVKTPTTKPVENWTKKDVKRNFRSSLPKCLFNAKKWKPTTVTVWWLLKSTLQKSQANFIWSKKSKVSSASLTGLLMRFRSSAFSLNVTKSGEKCTQSVQTLPK